MIDISFNSICQDIKKAGKNVEDAGRIWIEQAAFKEKLQKAKLQYFNEDAVISQESLHKLIQIGAVKKEHVDVKLIKAGDLYRKYFKLEDLFILADLNNSKDVIEDIVAR